MKGCLVVFLFLFAGASVTAKPCTKKDNRDEYLGEVHDQGESDWCYAFVAADLLSHKLKKKISALDIAYIYNGKDEDQLKTRADATDKFINTQNTQELFETGINGGDAGDAIDYAKELGVCENQYLPSDDSEFNDLKNAIDRLHVLKRAMDKDPNMCDYHDYFHTFERFPALNLREILKIVYTAHHEDITAALAAKSCEGKRIDISKITVKKEVVDSKVKGSRQKAFDMIDEALEADSIAAVSFPMKMIEPDMNDLHQAVVVGREYNKKAHRCEYILRDSNGPDHHDKNRYKNKDGYYWVPEVDLKKNLIDATRLE